MAVSDPLRVYLAGPDVFVPNASQVGDEKKRLCRSHGFEGVFPLDNELDLENLTKHERGLAISCANEKLIRSCRLLVANLAPFRGVSLDVGTAYEMGFARALDLPVFGYTCTNELLLARTQHAEHGAEGRDVSMRDRDDLEIEDFDMHDNLMIEGAIYASRGIVVEVNSPRDPIRNLMGFERCLAMARRTGDRQGWMPWKMQSADEG